MVRNPPDLRRIFPLILSLLPRENTADAHCLRVINALEFQLRFSSTQVIYMHYELRKQYIE